MGEWTTSMVANSAGTQFKAGQSGNPSGRPAASKEWGEKCRKFMSERGGFDKLVGIAEGKGDPKDQFKALQFIAEQAYGRAVTQIAGADEDEFSKLRIIIERGTSEPKGDANDV